jgi:hypothetical protein
MKRVRWGWRVVAFIGALLLADGLWLVLAVGTEGVFRQDTGAAMHEVRATYPAVVDVMTSRGKSIGVLVMGLGLITLVQSVAGLRGVGTTPSTWFVGPAWSGAFAVFVTVAALTASMLASGAVQIAVTWAAFALLLALGLIMARAGRPA